MMDSVFMVVKTDKGFRVYDLRKNVRIPNDMDREVVLEQVTKQPYVKFEVDGTPTGNEACRKGLAFYLKKVAKQIDTKTGDFGNI